MSQQFDESKHRRDGDGKFATKSQAEAAGGTEAILDMAGAPGQYYTSERDEQIARRAEAARAQALQTGEAVPINLCDYPRDHPNYRADGGDYDSGENESVCGDYSVGDEPSVRITWATPMREPGDPQFVSMTTHSYVEVYYTDADGDRRQLEAGTDHDEAAADCEQRHQVWQVENDRLEAAYYQTGNSTGQEWDALRQHEEDEPRVEYMVSERTETIFHTDPTDPGSSEISSDYSYEGFCAPYIYSSLEKANEAARANTRRQSLDNFYPMAGYQA